MRKHKEPPKTKRLSATTRAERTFERHTASEDEDGQRHIVKQTVTEKVTVNDLCTPADKKDTRVFHRGARIA